MTLKTTPPVRHFTHTTANLFSAPLPLSSKETPTDDFLSDIPMCVDIDLSPRYMLDQFIALIKRTSGNILTRVLNHLGL